MDITMTTAEVKAGRKPLRNRTYRSVQRGDILDFGEGEVQYREATGPGIRRFTNQAYVDVKVIGGVMPCWMAPDTKFTIWRKR